MATQSITKPANIDYFRVPHHGTLTFNSDGSFTYTPAANYSGPDSFSYTANDGTAASDAATVSLTVTIAVAAGGACLADFKGQANLTISDLETTAGSLTLSASSSNTTLVPNGNITFGGSGSTRTVTISSASGKSGHGHCHHCRARRHRQHLHKHQGGGWRQWQ